MMNETIGFIYSNIKLLRMFMLRFGKCTFLLTFSMPGHTQLNQECVEISIVYFINISYLKCYSTVYVLDAYAENWHG